MDKFVAQLNVEHLRQQLAAESDPAKRDVLARLLREQEAALEIILAERAAKKREA